MLLWLHRWAAGCVVSLLAVLPATQTPAQHDLPGAFAAWAMFGHDPQRTAQGAGVGPLRASKPHLLMTGLTSPPAIGADGTLYALQFAGLAKRETLFRVLAVSSAGYVHWSSPAWPGGDSGPSPLLAPDGRVIFGGGTCRQPLPNEMWLFRGCLTALGATGRPLWHATPLGFTKDLPQPLVRPDGAVVRATVGPEDFPIMVYTPTGASRPLGAPCSWAAIALGTGNQLYAITTSNAETAGPCRAYSVHPGQAGSSVVALAANGARAWVRPLPALPARTPLPEGCQIWALTVDTRRGQLYAATSCTLRNGQPQVLVFALDVQGHFRWMVHHPGDGEPALALDRASGDLWLADNEHVQRITPAGTTRWQTTWRPTPHAPATPATRMTLALDAQGTAYVCGGDGLLRAVSPAGRALWQYQFKIPRYGFSSPPSAVIGPAGTLYVSSDDGLVAFAP